MAQSEPRSRDNSKPESELPEEPVNIHGHAVEVEKIVRAVTDDSSNEVAAVLVSGAAGIGKTTVAIQAGHQLKKECNRVVKFCSLRGAFSVEQRRENEENKEERVLREILSVCVRGHHQTNEHPRHVLLNWCRQLEHQLILILDNAEDAMEKDVEICFMDLLRDMRMCSRRKLKFLITSRRSVIESAVKTVEIGPLNEDESIQVLKNGANMQSDSEDTLGNLRKIADLCEHIPLALRLAGPLISKDSEYSIDELIQELKQNPTRTLRCEAMMKIAFGKLEEPLQHALVSLSVFVRSFDKNAAKALLGTGCIAYLTTLKERCLIQKVDERYLIHLLIRSYARQVGKEKFPHILAHGHQAFREYFLMLTSRNTKTYWRKDKCKDSFDDFNAERLNFESTLRDVSVMNIRNCKELRDLVDECQLVAPYISDCVPFKLYEDLLNGLLRFAESQKNVVHRVEILCLLHHERRKRGSAKQQKQGDVPMEKAIQLFEENPQAFNESGMSKVFYLRHFGRYLSQDRGNKSEAQPVLKKALEIYENKETESTTFDKASILGQIGHNAKELGMLNEARDCYLEALEFRQVRYGNHVLTAFAYKDLADYYLYIEDLPAAEENYKKAINILKGMNKAEHKETIPMYKNLGICLQKRKMNDKSRKTYEKGNEVADNTIEGNHKWKVWIKTYLALLLFEECPGEDSEAVRIAKEVFEMGNELGMNDWPKKKELENYLPGLISC